MVEFFQLNGISLGNFYEMLDGYLQKLETIKVTPKALYDVQEYLLFPMPIIFDRQSFQS
jgi:hypothetical protein